MTTTTTTHSSSDMPHPEGRASFQRVAGFFAILFVFTIAFMLYNSWRRSSGNVGDGREVASYGFDLSNLAGNVEALLTSGRSKDFLPALTPLQVVDADEMDQLKTIGPKAVTPAVLQAQADRTFKGWRRLVVSDDAVIGVMINGEARAYPLRYVQWHEIINDELGGEPILVTYSIMSDSAAVFSRVVGDETLVFGFSGLLYSGSLLLYDARPDAEPEQLREAVTASGAQLNQRYINALTSSYGESLWSQLEAGPISGSALRENKKLTHLPIWHGRWADWLEMHPESTVFAGDRAQADAYKIKPQGLPWQTGETTLPMANPLPESPAYEALNQSLWITRESADGPYVATPISVDQPVPSDLLFVTRYFAWAAMHPDTEFRPVQSVAATGAE